MIGLSVKFLFFSIGDGDFFNSFFYSIHHHLERDSWGDTYPCVFGEFYLGHVAYDRLPILDKELKEIQERLKLFSPSQVVWDIEDSNKNPPWGNELSESITDLSNYYVTSSGKDLFEVLFNAIEEAKKLRSDIKVRSTFQKSDLPTG